MRKGVVSSTKLQKPLDRSQCVGTPAAYINAYRVWRDSSGSSVSGAGDRTKSSVLLTSASAIYIRGCGRPAR